MALFETRVKEPSQNHQQHLPCTTVNSSRGCILSLDQSTFADSSAQLHGGLYHGKPAPKAVTCVKSCDRNDDGTGEQLHSRSMRSNIACFVRVCDFGCVAHGWLTNKHSKHICIVHTSPAPKALQLPKSTEGHEPKADKKYHCLNIGRYKP